MTDFAGWLYGFVAEIFQALFDLVKDLFIAIFEVFLQAVVGLFSLLPVPFEGAQSLQGVLDTLSPEVWFFLGYLQLPGAFGVIGTAFVFRFTRKLLTLFQW